MSILPYQPPSDEEIFRLCTKECGVITATEDQQYFALGCIFCAAKFLYFDEFIGHMQTDHAAQIKGQKGIFGGVLGAGYNNAYQENTSSGSSAEDITDPNLSLLVPQTVVIKEEVEEETIEPSQSDNSIITGFPSENDLADATKSIYGMKQNTPTNSIYPVKQEHIEPDMGMDRDRESYASSNYEDYSNNDDENDTSCQGGEEDDDENNYEDLVEQSLLGGSNGNKSGLATHIKDRKMIQFIIDSYRRNQFLWDHRDPQFRDRVRRQQFLDWIVKEFKRRFNFTLESDTIILKWRNLCTIYKKECNRMSWENTNTSTIWYFKELDFLNRLYGGHQKIPDDVVKTLGQMRRPLELSTELEERKRKRRLYMRNYRAKLSEEAREAYLQRMREHAAEILASESEQARETRLQQMRQRAAELRAREPEQVRETRLQQMRRRRAELRATEPEQLRETRLQQMREHAAEIRSSGSEQVRQTRSQQMRQHATSVGGKKS